MESQSLALKLEVEPGFFPIKTVKKPTFQQRLPKSSELPDSDEKPVDNELQTLIPTLLHDILDEQWNHRTDWFFGVNMGIYHTTGEDPKKPIVPDGFLSLNVNLWKSPHGRKSYIVWEENDVVPTLVLEVVSGTYGGEYDDKMTDYARLGVLYYVISNPQFSKRHRRDPLEVYRLVDGKYVRQSGEPVFMEELGLGIGYSKGIYKHRRREWLYWYDKNGKRLKPPAEQLSHLQRQKERALQKAKQAEQRAELLAKRLQEMGIDPNSLI
jgi:Uma2 family endonuclease